MLLRLLMMQKCRPTIILSSSLTVYYQNYEPKTEQLANFDVQVPSMCVSTSPQRGGSTVLRRSNRKNSTKGFTKQGRLKRLKTV